MATKTIKRAKAHITSNRDAHRAVAAGRGAKDHMQHTYLGENVSRCHRCPPDSFCGTCNGINRARIAAGLIRPRHMDVDHPNNCISPWPLGRGRMPDARGSAGPVVTASIQQLGGGWRQGIATLNRKVIYEGPKTQSMDEAWDYAKRSADAVKEGLRFEQNILAR